MTFPITHLHCPVRVHKTGHGGQSACEVDQNNVGQRQKRSHAPETAGGPQNPPLRPFMSG